MKLYIDTSSREKIIVGLDSERFESNTKEAASQLLLPFIDEVLNKKGKTVKDITEIEVNTGPGSFTGLRVGVSVANTLGWVLKVPVNGQDVQNSQSVDINYEK
jgi:tRNA threonylcarbamoyladenosine biosynthesis protein TsaB